MEINLFKAQLLLSQSQLTVEFAAEHPPVRKDVIRQALLTCLDAAQLLADALKEGEHANGTETQGSHVRSA